MNMYLHLSTPSEPPRRALQNMARYAAASQISSVHMALYIGHTAACNVCQGGGRPGAGGAPSTRARLAEHR